MEKILMDTGRNKVSITLSIWANFIIIKSLFFQDLAESKDPGLEPEEQTQISSSAIY